MLGSWRLFPRIPTTSQIPSYKQWPSNHDYYASSSKAWFSKSQVPWLWLPQTHQARTRMEHWWWGYERRATNLELEVTRLETREVGSDEVRNLRSWEWHKRMKTEIKFKETRWGETRILDWCINDWRLIPWKGPRRVQVFILRVEVHALKYSVEYLEPFSSRPFYRYVSKEYF